MQQNTTPKTIQGVRERLFRMVLYFLGPDFSVQADVTSKESIEKLVKEIEKHEKHIDLLGLLSGQLC
jgi:enoyl-[acyl-carrier-protein] reductase (NADH)